MKEQMRIHYDKEGDFLEIGVGMPSSSLTKEVTPGIFIRKDEKTQEVKSIGILGFKKRTKKYGDIELLLPIKIKLHT